MIGRALRWQRTMPTASRRQQMTPSRVKDDNRNPSRVDGSTELAEALLSSSLRWEMILHRSATQVNRRTSRARLHYTPLGTICDEVPNIVGQLTAGN
jgi:hypothetical protein